jgi:hypothetical protein
LSILSRLFVGLLVVLSLLLSSAVIVWVNKTEDFKAQNVQATAKYEAERKAHMDASNEAKSVKDTYQLAIATYNKQVDQLQGDIKAKDQEISKREVELAELRNQARQLNVAKLSMSEALLASENQKKQQAEQIAALRTITDDLQKQKSDLNIALSDVQNKYDVTRREWTFMKEQLAETQGTSDKLTRQVKDLGGNPAQLLAGLKAGAPPINGIVREVKTLDDNRQWATISVGTADQVQKGMEFKVIDRNSGNFLGILTVESVQPNEAVGILTGPKVQEVKQGNEVRTQL